MWVVPTQFCRTLTLKCTGDKLSVSFVNYFTSDHISQNISSFLGSRQNLGITPPSLTIYQNKNSRKSYTNMQRTFSLTASLSSKNQVNRQF